MKGSSGSIDEAPRGFVSKQSFALLCKSQSDLMEPPPPLLQPLKKRAPEGTLVNYLVKSLYPLGSLKYEADGVSVIFSDLKVSDVPSA